MKDSIEISPEYFLGDRCQNEGWLRFSLFYKKANQQGGSVNTRVAEIDIIKHPPKEAFKAHTEIKFLIRNDIKLKRAEVLVDKNKKELRHPEDILDTGIIDLVVAKLKEQGLITLPLSIYVCMDHVESFSTEGDIWKKDKG